MNARTRLRLPCTVLAASAGVAVIGGCALGDPAKRMIAMVDAMPAEKRPPDWDRTKALMSRNAPDVASIAPDFSLSGADGGEPVKLSTYAPGRPKVLIFASFT